MYISKLLKAAFPGAKPVHTFAHSFGPTKIPQRPFLVLTEKDKAKIAILLKAYLTGSIVMPSEIRMPSTGPDFKSARWEW